MATSRLALSTLTAGVSTRANLITCMTTRNVVDGKKVTNQVMQNVQVILNGYYGKITS